MSIKTSAATSGLQCDHTTGHRGLVKWTHTVNHNASPKLRSHVSVQLKTEVPRSLRCPKGFLTLHLIHLEETQPEVNPALHMSSRTCDNLALLEEASSPIPPQIRTLAPRGLPSPPYDPSSSQDLRRSCKPSTPQLHSLCSSPCSDPPQTLAPGPTPPSDCTPVLPAATQPMSQPRAPRGCRPSASACSSGPNPASRPNDL